LRSADGPSGPSGVPSLPPPWLASRSLPVLVIPAGAALFRVHQAIHSPIFFGPAIEPLTGVRQPPTNRFDSLTGALASSTLATRSVLRQDCSHAFWR
jgi:hypothetical protein